MRNLFRWAVIAALFASLGVALGSVARAEEPVVVDTVLTIVEPEPVTVGEAVTVAARLTTASGQGIPNVGVEFYLDGQWRRALTDTTATVTLRISGDLSAGYHPLSAVFNGIASRGLAPATASSQLRINPAVLEVETVPALSGARFLIVPAAPDAEFSTFVSGQDGIGRIGIDRAGSYRLGVLPWDDSQAGVRAAFARWSDDVFFPSREMKITSSVRLQVGFDVSYPVGLRLVDLAGRPVDWQEATSATVTSSTGAHETFLNSEPKWLPGGRVVRRSSGLEETKILYSVESVTVRGSNVVNSKQQRFYPSENQEWQVQLSLYSARFTARDALFRFPIGSGIRLQYPDGHSERLSFDSKGALTVTSLPRGTYRVKVDGPGISFSRPVVLSRDQEMQLEVISYLDVTVVLALVASLALGLLFIGRPYLLSIFRPPTGPVKLDRRSVRPEDH